MTYITIFVFQVLNYCLLCINYRAVAQANYLHIAVSDFAVATVTYFLIRKVATAAEGSVLPWLAYASGGVVGSLLGVWLSATYLG